MAALTPRDVVNALQTLSDDQTKELFFQLKVPLHTLSNIEKDHKGNMRKIHYVQAWYDGDEGASWDKIVSGLRQIGLKTVAEGLATQHGLSVAPASVDVNQSSHQMTPLTPSPVTTAPTLTDHTQPSTLTDHAPPSTLTDHTPPSTLTDHAPPSTVTDHAPPSTLTDHAQPSTVTDHAQPSAITDHAQSSTVTDHAQPSTLTDHTQPSTVSDHAQPSAITDHAQPSTVTFWSVEKVKVTILQLKKRFADLTADAEDELGELEKQDKRFLKRFRRYLLLLPVAKKATHVKFFHENEKCISAAENTSDILNILCRYIDYRNYEILLQLVTSYCAAPLQESMQEYCRSLEGFEKATPIDIYLAAIPDEANEELGNAFSKMVVRIDKPASECTLYDIRKLNEAIIQGSSLCFHSVYIGGVANKCVEVVVSFPSSAVGWVLSAMTPAFMHTHLLSEVAVDGRQLTIFEADSDELVSAWLLHALSNDGVL